MNEQPSPRRQLVLAHQNTCAVVMRLPPGLIMQIKAAQQSGSPVLMRMRMGDKDAEAVVTVGPMEHTLRGHQLQKTPSILQLNSVKGKPGTLQAPITHRLARQRDLATTSTRSPALARQQTARRNAGKTMVLDDKNAKQLAKRNTKAGLLLDNPITLSKEASSGYQGGRPAADAAITPKTAKKISSKLGLPSGSAATPPRSRQTRPYSAATPATVESKTRPLPSRIAASPSQQGGRPNIQDKSTRPTSEQSNGLFHAQLRPAAMAGKPKLQRQAERSRQIERQQQQPQPRARSAPAARAPPKPKSLRVPRVTAAARRRLATGQEQHKAPPVAVAAAAAGFSRVRTASAPAARTATGSASAVAPNSTPPRRAAGSKKQLSPFMKAVNAATAGLDGAAAAAASSALKANTGLQRRRSRDRYKRHSDSNDDGARVPVRSGAHRMQQEQQQQSSHPLLMPWHGEADFGVMAAAGAPYDYYQQAFAESWAADGRAMVPHAPYEQQWRQQQQQSWQQQQYYEQQQQHTQHCQQRRQLPGFGSSAVLATSAAPDMLHQHWQPPPPPPRQQLAVEFGGGHAHAAAAAAYGAPRHVPANHEAFARLNMQQQQLARAPAEAAAAAAAASTGRRMARRQSAAPHAAAAAAAPAANIMQQQRPGQLLSAADERYAGAAAAEPTGTSYQQVRKRQIDNTTEVTSRKKLRITIKKTGLFNAAIAAVAVKSVAETARRSSDAQSAAAAGNIGSTDQVEAAPQCSKDGNLQHRYLQKPELGKNVQNSLPGHSRPADSYGDWGSALAGSDVEEGEIVSQGEEVHGAMCAQQSQQKDSSAADGEAAGTQAAKAAISAADTVPAVKQNCRTAKKQPVMMPPAKSLANAACYTSNDKAVANCADKCAATAALAAPVKLHVGTIGKCLVQGQEAAAAAAAAIVVKHCALEEDAAYEPIEQGQKADTQKRRQIDLGPPGYEAFVDALARDFPAISRQEQYEQYKMQYKSKYAMYTSLQRLVDANEKAISTAKAETHKRRPGSTAYEESAAELEKLVAAKQPMTERWSAATCTIQQELQAIWQQIQEWEKIYGSED